MKTVRRILFVGIFGFVGLLALGSAARASSEEGAEPPPSESPENTLDQNLPPTVKVERDIPYVRNGHRRQKLNLYIPVIEKQPVPLIVFIHGGGWCVGSQADCPRSFAVLLAQGYAIASVGYRLSQDVHFPGQLEDCKAAIRWLRAHRSEYHLQTDSIGVVGPSAGGHLAALVGTTNHTREFDVGENLDQSSAVQAVVDFYGPTDLSQMLDNSSPGRPRIRNNLNSAEARLLGGAVDDPAKAQLVRKANPIFYLTHDAPPFLIVHGDEDPTVPHRQSELLYGALREEHVPVCFITVARGRHGERLPVRELFKTVREFFDDHLKGISNRYDSSTAEQYTVSASNEEF